jgi:carbon storage regulator
MITLTRRVNESVLINEDIRVTVVHLKNHRVRLQIDAPSNISVRRERLELDDLSHACHITQKRKVSEVLP